MRAIDIGIGHDDQFVITGFGNIEVSAESGTHRRKQRTDLFVGKDLVD
ncbi:hypothetical protein SDC9_176562 [bioreactor metagenome]|uniref:Uncharacterized protein n=1 Tax=bioreactor metagenome TaxID=1076179 RepID=A0A645GQC5_9ZZZZ